MLRAYVVGGGFVGVVLGILAAFLLWPEIPIVGQPPLDIVLKILAHPKGSLDYSYTSAFLEKLNLCVAIGAITGAFIGFIGGNRKPT